MNAPRLLRLSIVGFWTLFWGLSVVDKVVPDVHPFWVGKDFFALFAKCMVSRLNDRMDHVASKVRATPAPTATRAPGVFMNRGAAPAGC